MCVSTAQDRTSSRKTVVPVRGIFFENCRVNTALRTCPWDSMCMSIAQDHVDCAGSHKKDGARPFPVNSRVNRFFDMSMCISTAQTRIKQLSRLHHNLARFICCTFKGPSGIWKCWPRSCDDFVHVLMKSSGTILYKFVIVCVRRFGEDLAYLADIV